MVVADQRGAILLANALAETLFGYPRRELIGERVELLVPERFRQRHGGHRERYGRNPRARPMGAGLELYGRRKDGSEFPVEISLAPVKATGKILVASAIRDITARRQAEQDASHLAAVVESSHDAIIGKDLDGTIISWNHGATRLYGYTAAEARGRSMSILVPPGHDDELPEILRRVRAGERVKDHETVRARKDGTQVVVSLTVSPIRERAGAVVGAATIARDISVQLRYQEQLRFLAEHDGLTGTRSRRRFERDVADQIARAHRHGERAALLMIDLDDFKGVNDRHGHRAGDRLLKAIGAALIARLRGTDVIARPGGDEFAVLLPYANGQQARVVADALRETIAGCTVDVGEGQSLGVTASIGIALIDEHTESDDAVLTAADRAMYADKAARTRPGSELDRARPGVREQAATERQLQLAGPF